MFESGLAHRRLGVALRHLRTASTAAGASVPQHVLHNFPSGWAAPRVVHIGVGFAEGPRYQPASGDVLFSDMPSREVVRLSGFDGAGSASFAALLDMDRPSGLGSLPDGRLLVVGMDSFTVLRQEAAVGPEPMRLELHGNMRAAVAAHDSAGLEAGEYMVNDMVTDVDGNCYVGLDHNGPKDALGRRASRPAPLLFMDGSGAVSVAAEDLVFANGIVISADGKTLLCAETYGGRITAWDVERPGVLRRRRVWAELDNCFVDGMCLDAEGMLWVAVPHATTEAVARLSSGLVGGGDPDGAWRGFVRMAEGGRIVEAVELAPGEANGRLAIACVLARDSLLMLEAFSTNNKPATLDRGNSRVCSVRVRVPAATMPSCPRYCAGYCL